MGFFGLVISFGFLCIGSKFLTGAQGYSCVSSCNGLTNGDYQSCLGCNVYVTCSNGYIYDNRSCPANLVWDDNLKRCEYTSPTCPGAASSTTSAATTTATTTTNTTNTCPNCCVDGEINVILTSNSGEVTGDLSGVGIFRNLSDPVGNKECSRSIVFKADFDRITNNNSCDVAECFTTPPFCGQRVLKIELQLSNGTRSGRLINVGDSSGNNGFGGDNSRQENDAEVDLFHPNALIYPSDKCIPYNGPRFRADNITESSVNNVNLYIGNNYVKITADNGEEFNACDECLFALNGQSDASPGGINERVFVGINTVIRRFSRLGEGVCGARLTWACGFD